MLIRAILILAVASFAAGCIHVFNSVVPQEIDPARPPVSVTTPVKAHLLSGETVVFSAGAAFTADSILGEGSRFPLRLVAGASGMPVRGLPLDSVAALETFKEQVRPVETVAVSVLATGAGAIGTAVLMVAIFGSCPTIYSTVDGVATLDAEAFPNAIVPLFEVRDVDRLSVSDDVVELEVRNEALETHYINQLQLLEVSHQADATAVPDNDGRIWVLEGLHAPTRVMNRAGEEISFLLSEEDGFAYETPSSTIQSATPEDVVDYLEIDLNTGGAKEAFIYLRIRNSLLSSVFFYEYMLDSQGANALNWMGNELNSIGGAVELGGFYQKHMGLRIETLRNGRFEEVGRVREVGPVAWDHVAVAIPTAGADTLRVRLRFIADAWRIDRLALGTAGRRAEPRAIAPSRVRGGDLDASELLRLVAGPDEAYAVTHPGDRFWIEFEPGRATDEARTYFIAAQGYYTEWIRGDWVRDDVHGEPFSPDVEILHSALLRWHEVKKDFERRFESSRIPVR